MVNETGTFSAGAGAGVRCRLDSKCDEVAGNGHLRKGAGAGAGAGWIRILVPVTGTGTGTSVASADIGTGTGDSGYAFNI